MNDRNSVVSQASCRSTAYLCTEFHHQWSPDCTDTRIPLLLCGCRLHRDHTVWGPADTRGLACSGYHSHGNPVKYHILLSHFYWSKWYFHSFCVYSSICVFHPESSSFFQWKSPLLFLFFVLCTFPFHMVFIVI